MREETKSWLEERRISEIECVIPDMTGDVEVMIGDGSAEEISEEIDVAGLDEVPEPDAAPVRAVRGGAVGPALIAVLGATGRLQLGFGFTATLGLAIGS